MDKENKDAIDCRELGLGHEFHKFEETGEEEVYRCVFCGKERREPKRGLILPPRMHEQ